MLDIIDWVGRGTTVLFIITVVVGIYGWLKGILPALLRLGFGLSKRKIAIFAAQGAHLDTLKEVLVNSNLFHEKNLLVITSADQLSRAERATLYLVFWHDWTEYIDKIMERKKEGTALVIYAPQDLGFIPQDKMRDLGNEPNVVIANALGRLLNDILVCMMTTSYE